MLIIIFHRFKKNCKVKIFSYLENSQRVNAAFGNGSVKESIIGHWYAKLETGDDSLTNEDPSRAETVVEKGDLRAIIEKNSSNTVRDYAEELGVSLTIISRHLKLIGKVKKNG